MDTRRLHSWYSYVSSIPIPVALPFRDTSPPHLGMRRLFNAFWLACGSRVWHSFVQVCRHAKLRRLLVGLDSIRAQTHGVLHLSKQHPFLSPPSASGLPNLVFLPGFTPRVVAWPAFWVEYFIRCTPCGWRLPHFELIILLLYFPNNFDLGVIRSGSAPCL